MKTKDFEACIIGSGAAGGIVAKELCEGGAKVIMLEAGHEVSPSQFLSHKWPYELRYRGLGSESYPAVGGSFQAIPTEDSDDASRWAGYRILGGGDYALQPMSNFGADQDFGSTRVGLVVALGIERAMGETV